MKIRNNLTLRKVGKNYMIVEANAEGANFSNVYSMNETAAWIWNSIGDSEFTIDGLVERVCREYGIDRSLAEHDIRNLLDDWKEFGLLA